MSRRILAETHGNPLAITQLSRGVTAAELSAGFGPSAGLPLSGQIEQSFRRRFEQLSPTARSLLVLASAEPLGDPAVLRRGAHILGLSDDLAAADTGGLMMSVGLHVQFEHPLARSAIYGAGTADERRASHRAIAQVLDPDADPERRAWHRSQAATAADEEIAAELEASADRALFKGGLAASAALLERSASLSTTRAEAVRRGLAAARATYEAGAPDRALKLVAGLETGPMEPLDRATAIRLRGQIAVALGEPRQATTLLLDAAGAFAVLDVRTSRETYLEAFEAAMQADRFTADGSLTAVAAEIARVLPDALGVVTRDVGDTPGVKVRA